jgi:hypothetical protein
MKRRELIMLVGGSAAAGPFTARGQQPAMTLLGFLGASTPEARASLVTAFERRRLRKLGWIEGRTITSEGGSQRYQDITACVARST